LIKDLATDPERIFNYLSRKAIRAFELYRKHFDKG